jgi:uncharacterized protein
MYTRLLKENGRHSFFLFGPRGVGKTAWIQSNFGEHDYIDLLTDRIYTDLLASPGRLSSYISKARNGSVIIDEVQRVPALLNEVHRLIEAKKHRFILTGSSARKLRSKGVNLLAGRALTRFMHPLTATEVGPDFDLKKMIRFGGLPSSVNLKLPERYLKSYVATYLREEVLQEGIVRNIAVFAKFLEAASFSQGAVLNMASVARDTGVAAKVVGDYFGILEDLLVAVRIPVFARRAKRKLVTHSKFYLFDAGVFQAVRPRGPLDSESEIAGPALETVVLHHLRAINDALELDLSISYFRTQEGVEVDFVVYGENVFHAIEVKSSVRVRPEDLQGLRMFQSDYPEATCTLLYLGTESFQDAGIRIVPAQDYLKNLPERLRSKRRSSD